MLFTALCLLSACAPIQLTRPVTKIGLVAPFESAQRVPSYEALNAVKMALHETNAAGGAGGWLVELVALNDSGQLEQTLWQARTFAVDPDVTHVLAVVNTIDSERVQAEYARQGLSISLVDIASDGPVPDAAFIARYQTLSSMTPGPLALRVYSATQAALAQIANRKSRVAHRLSPIMDHMSEAISHQQ